MNTQSEFPSFKQLLKQLYNAHSTKVKDLENQIKILQGKLAAKERESNNSLTECKRCIELEEAFKSCKKALQDQSNLLENFGQRFSIFSSSGFENKNLKSVDKPPSYALENNKNPGSFKNDVTTDNYELSVMSLEDSTFTETKINNTRKIPLSANNQNLLKKVMQTDENIESFDVYTVTFPEHLKQGTSTPKFDSLILAPDSLDVTPDNKKLLGKKTANSHLGDAKNKTEQKTNESEILKDAPSLQQESKKSTKRQSSESLNDERIKRCNTGEQLESIDACPKLGEARDTGMCNVMPTKSVMINEGSSLSVQSDKKITALVKDKTSQNIPVKKAVVNVMEPSDNKTDASKNLNISNNKNKSTLSDASPSLLPRNVNAPPKIIDLETVSNDDNDDDFQELATTGAKPAQSEDSWDACDKKKVLKKQRSVKSIKSSSKFKMTLVAPPPNYKKPTYKQTKLSKSLFKCKTSEKSCEKLSDNVNPVIIDEDSSPVGLNQFQTSSPCDTINSPRTIDIDATFIPENFRIETRSYTTTNVKKNAVEKSHLRNGNLFSNISFPGELPHSSNNEEHNKSDNGNDSISPVKEDVKENMNSFDRLPLPDEPAYKYKNDVVRKKCERKKLNAFDCDECEKYYSELGLSDREKKNRMKKCSRHRGKFSPPRTPDHFWELEFPDTQECKARGYLKETQKVRLSGICNL